MNRSEFILRYNSIVNLLREKPNRVVLSGGGALLILGLREQSADLDLDVPNETFERLRTASNVEWFGDTEIVNLSIDVSLHRLKSSTQTIVVDGVCIYSIDELIAQKKSLIANPNRKKEKILQDHADIKALYKLKRHRQPASFKW